MSNELTEPEALRALADALDACRSLKIQWYSAGVKGVLLSEAYDHIAWCRAQLAKAQGKS